MEMGKKATGLPINIMVVVIIILIVLVVTLFFTTSTFREVFESIGNYLGFAREGVNNTLSSLP